MSLSTFLGLKSRLGLCLLLEESNATSTYDFHTTHRSGLALAYAVNFKSIKKLEKSYKTLSQISAIEIEVFSDSNECSKVRHLQL